MITGATLPVALAALGYPERPQLVRPVSGGCISRGRQLVFPDNRSLFLKSKPGPFDELFAAEAHGLSQLRSGPLRAPEPLATGREDNEPYLLLEWVESGARGSRFSESLGSGLAALHRITTDQGFGLDRDNFIGATEQPNGWVESWIGFFGERRLFFQAELAATHRRLDAQTCRQIERIVGRLGEYLPQPSQPALLHGDLWSGNLMVDTEGSPVLIDPAAYFGHREADLAMTQLFGGFPARFLSCYTEAWPLEPGFDDRVDLYNLYHMLNHLNLFGGGYLGSVMSIVSRYA